MLDDVLLRRKVLLVLDAHVLRFAGCPQGVEKLVALCDIGVEYAAIPYRVGVVGGRLEDGLDGADDAGRTERVEPRADADCFGKAGVGSPLLDGGADRGGQPRNVAGSGLYI